MSNLGNHNLINSNLVILIYHKKKSYSAINLLGKHQEQIIKITCLQHNSSLSYMFNLASIPCEIMMKKSIFYTLREGENVHLLNNELNILMVSLRSSSFSSLTWFSVLHLTRLKIFPLFPWTIFSFVSLFAFSPRDKLATFFLVRVILCVDESTKTTCCCSSYTRKWLI